MRKHELKIEVVKVMHNRVHFKITKQTHELRNFSNQENGYRFIASNGYKLSSTTCPSWNSISKELSFFGEVFTDEDIIISVALEDFNKILEAIEEYNNTNGKGYEAQWPQVGDVYFCVAETGIVRRFVFSDESFDYIMMDVGNFYKTEAKAKEVAEVIKIVFNDNRCI